MSLSGRLVDLPVGRLFVHQGGSGPPLVLVHGLFVSHYYFRPIVEELERHFSVTAFDLPGFGESDHPDPERYRYDAVSAAEITAELMNVLGIPKAHVLGHSMGGGVALSLAARHPTQVDRLVLEDSWVYPIELTLTARLSLVPFIGSMLFERLLSRRDFAKHFYTVPHDPSIITEEYLDYYWERFNRAGARRAAHAALKAYSMLPDHSEDPGRISAPTLILWGDEDRLIPVEHGHRLAHQIPGARLVVVPACGHSPHEEQPAAALSEIVSFLEGREKPACVAP